MFKCVNVRPHLKMQPDLWCLQGWIKWNKYRILRICVFSKMSETHCSSSHDRCQRNLENHGFTEWFHLEGTFKNHRVQHPCHHQRYLSLDQAAQIPVQPDLDYKGASTTLLSNLCHCLTILTAKYFLLISNLNLLPFSLKPLAFPSPAWTTPTLSTFLL